MAESYVIRAPASTANLGSGFDAVAIALELYNEIEARVDDIDRCDVSGDGADTLLAGAPNLVLVACNRLFASVDKVRPPLALHLRNGVPFGRGLGSSAAAIAAGLRLGEALLDTQLPDQVLLTLAARIEGHGDNTTAALLGGCTVGVDRGETVAAAKVELPERLRIVAFVPTYSVPTSAARAALPAQVPRADAVFNVGRAALLVAALQSGRTDLLAVAMDDRLHQPYRSSLYRGMTPILEAARQSGAYGAAVSGAGPSAAALTDVALAGRVAAAMESAARDEQVGGIAMVLRPDGLGARRHAT